MKIKNILLLGSLIFLNPWNAVAESAVTPDVELQQLRMKYNNLVTDYQSTATEVENPILRRYAFFQELPGSAGDPNYKFSAVRYDDEFSITFWRARLILDKYVPLVRIEPMSVDGVFICSSSFTVIQNGKQFDDIKLHSGDDDSYCNTLFVGKTLILDQRYSTQKFDDEQAFTVIYDSLKTFRFEIPNLSGAGNVPAPINKSVIVDPNLDIHMPTAIFDGLNIWVDLEYKGTDSDKNYNWRLKDYGVNQ